MPRSGRTPRRSSSFSARRAAVVAQVGHGGQLHAGVQQRERRPRGRGRRRPPRRRARPGCTAVERGQPAGAAGEHHAGQVVAGEQQRLLDRAGGVDDAAGADLVQRVALPDGHQPVEGAQRRRAREHLHPCLARLRGQLARALVAALGEQPAARLGALVAEHHVGALLGGGESPRSARPRRRRPPARRAWRRRYSVRHSRSGWLRAMLAEARRRGAAPSRRAARSGAAG